MRKTHKIPEMGKAEIIALIAGVLILFDPGGFLTNLGKYATSPYTAALFLSVMPVLIVGAAWVSTGHNDRKSVLFFLGFAMITTFYIIAPDPEISGQYTAAGNYWYPTAVSLLSTVFLGLAFFFFGKHLRSRG